MLHRTIVGVLVAGHFALVAGWTQPVPVPAPATTNAIIRKPLVVFGSNPPPRVPKGLTPASSNWVVNPVMMGKNGPEPLAFDAINKEVKSKIGDTNAAISFCVTNISSSDVVIRVVRPSCGCTIAKMPSQPWTLHPGDNGEIKVSVDLRGKRGVLNKYLSVDTSAGYKLLTLKVAIPDSPMVGGPMDKRGRNLMAALADRQAVFKNDCAQCHVKPAVDKMGAPLYAAACGICHDSTHRATMVPDLHALKHPTSREYWTKWTRSGKVGTLMPAFALAEGGPLSDVQIDSLLDYLVTDFPKAAPVASVPTIATTTTTSPGFGPPPAPAVPASNPQPQVTVAPSLVIPASPVPGLPPLPTPSDDPPKTN